MTLRCNREQNVGVHVHAHTYSRVGLVGQRMDLLSPDCRMQGHLAHPIRDSRKIRMRHDMGQDLYKGLLPSNF